MEADAAAALQSPRMQPFSLRDSQQVKGPRKTQDQGTTNGPNVIWLGPSRKSTMCKVLADQRNNEGKPGRQGSGGKVLVTGNRPQFSGFVALP